MGSGEHYETLRDWYLARLRKAAQESQAQSLTPRALIDRDRQLVERLVVESSTAAQSSPAEIKSQTVGNISHHERMALGLMAGACAFATVALALTSIEIHAATETRILAAVVQAVVLILLLLAVVALLSLRRKLSSLALLVDGMRHGPTGIRSKDLGELTVELVRMYEEARLRELVIADAAPELIVSLDNELRVLAANRAIFQVCELLPEEFVGSHLLDRLLPEDVDSVCTEFGKARDTSTARIFNCRVFAKSRRAVDLEWIVEWSAREQTYFAVARDISARKILERARAESVAMLSHDVKQPLSSISLTAQSALEGVHGDVPQSLRASLNRILISSSRLLSMIKELLEFERMSEGKMTLELERFALPAIIHEAMENVTEQAKRSEITIDVHAEETVVHADKEKVLRVVTNLLSNAVKYGRKGDNVTVTCSQGREYVQVSVADTGPGIKPEYLHLIFERYERLEAGGSAIEGTGLGLAICKAIVESHGGLIGVDSQVDKGSTFWFTLPQER